MTKKFKNKIIALSLCVGMMFSQTAVFAAEDTENPQVDDTVIEEMVTETPTEVVEVTDETPDVDDFIDGLDTIIDVPADDDLGISDTLDMVSDSVTVGDETAKQIKVDGIDLKETGLEVEVSIRVTDDVASSIYRYQYYDFSDGGWYQIEDWTPEKKVTWKPEHKGDYYIYVQAMSGNLTMNDCLLLCNYNGCTAKINNITVDMNTKNLVLNADVTTNDKDIEYRWQIYDASTGGWDLIRDYSKTLKAEWTPEKDGDYLVYLEAKMADGSVATNIIFYNVNGASVGELTTDVTDPLFEETTLNVSGSYIDLYGVVDHTKLLIFDGTIWTVIAENSNTAKWKPGQGGTYGLCMQLFDEEDNLLNQKLVAVYVNRPYAIFTPIQAVQTDSMQYYLETTCNTNDPGLLIRWYAIDHCTGTHITISDWKVGNINATMKFPNVCKYDVYCEAKYSNGTTIKQSIVLDVQKYAADLQAMLNKANTYDSATSYILLVNCSTHRVGIFQGKKGTWTPIKYWQCADGKASTPTCKGVYTVKAKGRYFDSNNARCFWYTQFNGNYLFHSVLYYKNNPSKLMDGRVGMGLSHGCVRLEINNAKWIYDNIPKGSKVVTYR